MLVTAPTAGCGLARSVRRSCSDRHGQERHLPWSSPTFCCPRVQLSRPRQSRMSCGRPHRRVAAKGGRFSTTRAVKWNAHPVSNASVGHLSPPPADWDAAVVTAEAMVGASRLSGQRAGEHHWTERSGALLSTLLHAAATEELPMRDVLQWIDRHNGAPALEILASNVGGDAPATDLLAGIVATDSREQSGIWSTASGVLAAYRTEGALASTRRHTFGPRGVLRRRQHPLCLLSRSAAASIRATRGGHRG